MTADSLLFGRPVEEKAGAQRAATGPSSLPKIVEKRARVPAVEMGVVCDAPYACAFVVCLYEA